MALDDETGGDGVPIEDNGPEWNSVEEERDYWKALAQSQSAKLMMVDRVMKADWKIVSDEEGFYYAQADKLDFQVPNDFTKVTT